MQVPTEKVSIDRLVPLSIYAERSFEAYLETFEVEPPVRDALRSFAAKLAEGRTHFATTIAAHREAVLATLPIRIDVRMADRFADQAVRSVKRMADESGAAVARTLFPEGISPIVRPIGATEVRELDALLMRIGGLADWSGKDIATTKIRTALTRYQAALAARQTAARRVAETRYVRDLAREDFLSIYASVASNVKALFPRDAELSDLFFDTIDDRTSDAEPPDPTPAP